MKIPIFFQIELRLNYIHTKFQVISTIFKKVTLKNRPKIDWKLKNGNFSTFELFLLPIWSLIWKSRYFFRWEYIWMTFIPSFKSIWRILKKLDPKNGRKLPKNSKNCKIFKFWPIFSGGMKIEVFEKFEKFQDICLVERVRSWVPCVRASWSVLNF